MFDDACLSEHADAVAPDGCEVRVLVTAAGGSCAHFTLAAGQTSVAVRHRTVDEIWYFLSGRGVLWRRDDTREAEIDVGPGVAITIPCGTHFQFRADDAEPLVAVGVTMPPWPGDGEAVRSPGRWPSTVRPGPGLADE